MSYNIIIRVGLHCAPLIHNALGSKGTARVSFSNFNTIDEIDTFIHAMYDITQNI